LNKNWIFLGLALFVTLPGTIAVLTLDHFYEKQPILAAVILGLAVVGAAFLLSWACEVAQLDIPAALALSVLALIAVLPEYAVDFTLTFQASYDKEYEELAIANMIGANRMIVGFAWPLIVFLFWLRFRKTAVKLGKSQRVEIGFLGIAGIYSLIIPIKGHIDFIDVAVLVSLFVIYTIRISRQPVEEPHIIGPAELISKLDRSRRLTVVGTMLLFAGAVIFIVAHPFAESLIITGKNIGVDEAFMIQWFAPLASEAPEIVVCVLFTLRGLASAGLGALVASKVNQWTLLVGTLPIVYLIGKVTHNLPFSDGIRGIPLTGELAGAMFVTSGQTLLAVAIMLNLMAHLWEAGLLFFLLVAQFFFPNPEITLPNGQKSHGPANFFFFQMDSHIVFGVIYVALALVLFFRLRHEFVPIVRAMTNFKKQTEADIEDDETHDVVGHAAPAHSKEKVFVAQPGESKPPATPNPVPDDAIQRQGRH
jgi:cation:H+ antiporter